MTVLFAVAQSASAVVNAALPGEPAAQASSDRTVAMPDKKRQRDRSAASAAAQAQRKTGTSAHSDGPKDTGKAQQGKGQTASATSERVRALLNKQASRSRTAVAVNRRGAAPAAARGAARTSGNLGPGTSNPLPSRTNLSQGPASAVPNKAAQRAAVALPQSSISRIGTLGGPRAQGHDRLGGRVSTKGARAAALNGTQMLRRKY
jgi:hypothetical protein